MVVIVIVILKMVTSKGETASLLDPACFLSVYNVLDVIDFFNVLCSLVAVLVYASALVSCLS